MTTFLNTNGEHTPLPRQSVNDDDYYLYDIFSDHVIRQDSYKHDYDKLLPTGQVYVSGLRLKLDFMK